MFMCATFLSGGASRDRTDDPLLAKQVLSQLSYGPSILVGLGGLEPPTSPLSGVRSNHLSYRPRPDPLSWNAGNLCGRLQNRFVFAQKEVIQPHLPIRLPCYDFTPVIGHTVAKIGRASCRE